ncbi:hypothetical protein HPO96_09755 [Kribbella sandramycini]|uniref:Uncharacterized protein n=1 Tax=Kribbella sandramycini TaxID=60450 RepID=A0A7Y4KXM6_9ACTN|nr:hypothetical protein [Kribbella sandramycini]MBB6569638.1 hypothetical protein [Kribbella sandramycini]NOL40528.1 hypothetical protein [Kribbella sandramycini]
MSRIELRSRYGAGVLISHLLWGLAVAAVVLGLVAVLRERLPLGAVLIFAGMAGGLAAAEGLLG